MNLITCVCVLFCVLLLFLSKSWAPLTGLLMLLLHYHHHHHHHDHPAIYMCVLYICRFNLRLMT